MLLLLERAQGGAGLRADAAIERAGGNALPCQRELGLKGVLDRARKDTGSRRFEVWLRDWSRRGNRRNRRRRLWLHLRRRWFGLNGALRSRRDGDGLWL